MWKKKNPQLLSGECTADAHNHISIVPQRRGSRGPTRCSLAAFRWDEEGDQFFIYLRHHVTEQVRPCQVANCSTLNTAAPPQWVLTSRRQQGEHHSAPTWMAGRGSVWRTGSIQDRRHHRGGGRTCSQWYPSPTNTSFCIPASEMLLISGGEAVKGGFPYVCIKTWMCCRWAMDGWAMGGWMRESNREMKRGKEREREKDTGLFA